MSLMRLPLFIEKALKMSALNKFNSLAGVRALWLVCMTPDQMVCAEALAGHGVILFCSWERHA